ncbi:hypothetical protein ABZX65_26830 [Streptomyces sp. NPDC003300]
MTADSEPVPAPRSPEDAALERAIAAKPVQLPPLPADPHDRRLAMTVRGW